MYRCKQTRWYVDLRCGVILHRRFLVHLLLGSKVIQLTGCRFTEPDLNTHKDDKCYSKNNKKRDDLAASPGIGSSAPLGTVR